MISRGKMPTIIVRLKTCACVLTTRFVLMERTKVHREGSTRLIRGCLLKTIRGSVRENYGVTTCTVIHTTISLECQNRGGMMVTRNVKNSYVAPTRKSVSTKNVRACPGARKVIVSQRPRHLIRTQSVRKTYVRAAMDWRKPGKVVWNTGRNSVPVATTGIIYGTKNANRKSARARMVRDLRARHVHRTAERTVRLATAVTILQGAIASSIGAPVRTGRLLPERVAPRTTVQSVRVATAGTRCREFNANKK